MALKPHLWAMDEAPVDNPTATLILLALADEANDDGEGSAPYMAKLMQRGRCSERSAQNHLRDLFRARLINHGDPRVAMRRYGKGAGQAPRCWDLNLSATRKNMPTPRTDDEMRAEYSAMIGVKPGRLALVPPADEVQVEAGVQDLHPSVDQGKQDADSTGVQNLHPSETAGEVQQVAPQGCSDLHPTGAAGCTLPAVDLSAPEKTPPSLTKGESLPSEASRPSGGDLSDTEKHLLTGAVEAAQAERGDALGWHRSAIVDAMQAQLAAGHSAAKVAAAMITAAADPATKFPGRIGYLLTAPSSSTSVAAAAPAPEWAQGAMKYLDAETPRCRVLGHRSEPAIGCGKCKADAIAARLDEPEPALRPEESPELPEGERLTGAALARKIAAGAKTGATVRKSRYEPLVPSTTPPPSRLGELLGTAAAKIEGAA